MPDPGMLNVPEISAKGRCQQLQCACDTRACAHAAEEEGARKWHLYITALCFCLGSRANLDNTVGTYWQARENPIAWNWASRHG